MASKENRHTTLLLGAGGALAFGTGAAPVDRERIVAHASDRVRDAWGLHAIL